MAAEVKIIIVYCCCFVCVVGVDSLLRCPAVMVGEGW